MPLARQDVISAVRHDLSGPVFGVRGRQQPVHYTYRRRTAQGLAETVLHRPERQGQDNMRI